MEKEYDNIIDKNSISNSLPTSFNLSLSLQSLLNIKSFWLSISIKFDRN